MITNGAQLFEPSQVVIPYQFDPYMNRLERWLMRSYLRRACQLWEYGILRNLGFKIRPLNEVLELGCGEGWFSRYMVSATQSPRRYVGIDLDRKSIFSAIGYAWKRLGEKGVKEKRLAYFNYDCADLSGFPSNSFDRVVSFGLLHHAERWQDIVKEAVRLLRPGGLLGLDDFTKSGLNRSIHKLFSSPPRNAFTTGELLNCLQSSGMEIVDTTHRLFGDVVFVVAKKT